MKKFIARLLRSILEKLSGPDKDAYWKSLWESTHGKKTDGSPTSRAEYVKWILGNEDGFNRLTDQCNIKYNEQVAWAKKNSIIPSVQDYQNEREEFDSSIARTHNFSMGGYGQGGGATTGQLFNLPAGIGAPNDISNYDVRTAPFYTFQEVWTTFYQTSPIAKRLVDLLTQSAMRKNLKSWIQFSIEDGAEDRKEAKLKKVNKYFKDKNIYLIFYAAVRQMFMHGGSALYIDTDDVDLYQPLVPYQGMRMQLRLVDKSLMFPAGFDNIFDITKKNFNHPSHWSLTFFNGSQAQPIHESRFIFFIPEELPFYARINQLWWGNSVLLSVRNYINIVDRGFHSTGNQIQQASMAFLKTRIRSKANQPGVIANSVINKNNQFQNALNQNGNANILDKDDEIERLEVSNLKQQVEVSERIIQNTSCANGIPPSIFYGSSSGGYHASDSELLNWHNQEEANQAKYITPPLNGLIDLISIVLFGSKDTLTYIFSQLNEPTPHQAADIKLKQGQFYAICKKIGVPNILIIKQMFRDKAFDDLTLENLDDMIKTMNSFDAKMMMGNGPSMEGKDIKDDSNKRNKPTDKISNPAPESIVSEALYK